MCFYGYVLENKFCHQLVALMIGVTLFIRIKTKIRSKLNYKALADPHMNDRPTRNPSRMILDQKSLMIVGPKDSFQMILGRVDKRSIVTQAR